MSKTISNKQEESSSFNIHIVEERCKECSFCIEFCPQKVLAKSDVINSRGYHLIYSEDRSKCTGCNMCVMVCPEFAVNVTPTRKEPKKRR